MNTQLSMIFGALSTSSLIFCTPSYAENDYSQQDYLSLGIATYGALREGYDETTDFRLEYRSASTVLNEENLHPWAGIEVSSGKSIWVGAGLLHDIKLPIVDGLHFISSFGTGLYKHGEESHDLGHVIEFRTQLELSYTLSNNHKISVQISHLSNSSLSDSNPGIEVAGIYFSLPL